MSAVTCGSCDKRLTKADAESCWFCDSYLCYTCWDLLGHCGHEEAEAINEASRVGGVATRSKLIKAMHLDAEMLAPTEDEELN